MHTHLAGTKRGVSRGGRPWWERVWLGPSGGGGRTGLKRVGEGFQCSQVSGRLPGHNQGPTFPGLLKPHGGPQPGSLSWGQARCCRRGGEGGRANPP